MINQLTTKVAQVKWEVERVRGLIPPGIVSFDRRCVGWSQRIGTDMYACMHRQLSMHVLAPHVNRTRAKTRHPPVTNQPLPPYNHNSPEEVAEQVGKLMVDVGFGYLQVGAVRSFL